MQKKLIIGIVVAAALVLGVGGSYLAAKAISNRVSASVPPGSDSRLQPGIPGWNYGPGDRGWKDRGQFLRDGMGRGMMYPEGMIGPEGRMGPGQFNGYPRGSGDQQLERISFDAAVVNAQEYAAGVGDNLRVAEVMEFEDNFYAVVVESDTAKGAFELLVDPYGRVALEMGPSRMWNTKYGHMRSSATASATNKVTLEQAIAFAQKSLDGQVPGAVVSKNGIDFYGYYSFDYEIDGKVAGMLSVNGQDGTIWFHNWHGNFISEKEITE